LRGGDSNRNRLLQLEVNQQIYFTRAEVSPLLTQVEEMAQHGMPLKGFLCCLGGREFVANSPRSKLGSGLEFPTRPLKEASSEFPRHRKAEVGAPRLPSSRPKALNEGGEGDLRKVFARQELVMARSMPHGGMGCRYENKDQDLFDVLPMLSGSGAGEQLGE
jgi:hypothetical protein